MNHPIVQDRLRAINALLATVTPSGYGITGGKLGLSFYLFHAAKQQNDAALAVHAAALLRQVTESLESGEAAGLKGASLSEGAAGLAFALSYLQQNGYIATDTTDFFTGAEAFLTAEALADLDEDMTDFLHAAGGILLYFTLCKPSATTVQHLNVLVNKLTERAVETDDTAWFRNCIWPDVNRHKEINFGLAHGLSGLLLILLQAFPYIDNKRRVQELVHKGIRLMMQYELPVDYAAEEYAFFPGVFGIHDREIMRHERLGWCYGDLNQVLLLYRAGRLLGDAKYTAIADRIGSMVVQRTTSRSTLCTDTHFCHGTAGLAQCYKALYNEIHKYEYYAAYEHWIGRTLELAETEMREGKYEANPGSLLEGWAGVGMVLTEYASAQKMDWAKLLLL